MAPTLDTLFSAVEHKDAEAISRLIAAGADVNAKSPEPHHYGRSALHLCVWANYVEGACLLIDAGADVNQLDDLHDSPFLLSGAEGRLEILQYIFSNAKKINLVRAITAASKARAKAATPDYTVVNRYGGSALIPACERGHHEVVQLLLANGADPNHFNMANWTGLLEVVELGGVSRDYVEVVKHLIAGGADVNQPDGKGQTPLLLARRYNFKRIAALLEAAGAHE